MLVQDNYCECAFPSDPARVRPIVHNVLGFIADRHDSLTAEEHGDLKLIFSELIYNSIIHGNKKDPRKHVRLAVESKSKHVHASIMDEGEGFDHRAALIRARHEDSLLEESGRGMILVCALTDKLIYNERGNQVRFEKAVGVV